MMIVTQVGKMMLRRKWMMVMQTTCMVYQRGNRRSSCSSEVQTWYVMKKRKPRAVSCVERESE